MHMQLVYHAFYVTNGDNNPVAIKIDSIIGSTMVIFYVTY